MNFVVKPFEQFLPIGTAVFDGARHDGNKSTPLERLKYGDSRLSVQGFWLLMDHSITAVKCFELFCTDDQRFFRRKFNCHSTGMFVILYGVERYGKELLTPKLRLPVHNPNHIKVDDLICWRCSPVAYWTHLLLTRKGHSSSHYSSVDALIKCVTILSRSDSSHCQSIVSSRNSVHRFVAHTSDCQCRTFNGKSFFRLFYT